jgi:DNA modification methylase
VTGTIYLADNLEVLKTLPDGSVDLIYIDPPFNTGKVQRRTQLKTIRSPDGDRTGFQGRRYESIVVGTKCFSDLFDDYLAFLEPRLVEAQRVLAAHGSLYVHVDYREVHYCKVLLDAIFGRECFLNEIIWAYDYGGKPKDRWPAKHDNILLYARTPGSHVFNVDEIERIPYMAPGLVGPEKAARGKLPTDCYSQDTDILTRRGWIAFTDLRADDEVATVAPDGCLCYSRPVKIHAHPYCGEMVELTSKTINLLVTPNHRLYVRPKHHHQYQFIVAEAANQHGYYALRNQLLWQGRVETRFHVPAIDYQRPSSARPLPAFDMGDWCEFMGWYLSGGSSTFYRDRAEVHIAQTHLDQRTRIAQLLDRMGLRHQASNRGFTICNKQLATYVKNFGTVNEKRMPRYLLELPQACLARLYEALMDGDGNRKGNEWTYFTTSKQLADDVQELLIKLGFNANIREEYSDNPNWRTKYCVSRRTSKESTIFPDRHIRKLDYEGWVYCCAVEPYHTLIVRRKGKPAVCGNCWWHTIIPTNGSEKTGYPTQKPLGVLRRIVQASSRPEALVLDFFAGSGTTGVAALELGRRFMLVDNNPEALEVMARRFAGVDGIEWIGFDPAPHQNRAEERGLFSTPAVKEW